MARHHHKLRPATARGLQAVRADAGRGDVAALIEEHGRTFAAFREATDRELADLRRGQTDVVTSEQVQRIDAALEEQSSALDAVTERLERLALGGAANDTPEAASDPQYRAAFATWFRRGRRQDEESLQSLIEGGPQAALTGATDAAGGYLAPVEWDRTVQRELRDVSPIRQIATVQTAGVRGFDRLYQVGRPASGWVGETDARSETTTPTLQPLNFPVMEQYANPAISQRMLDDAETDIEGWLAGEVRDVFADAENTAFVAGDGDKKPHGLLDYVTGGASAARHPLGAITLVNSGDAADLTVDGFFDIEGDLKEPYLPNARWLMRRSTVTRVRKLRDGDGNLIWAPGLQAGVPSTILGYPYSRSDDMETIAAGNTPVLFGDFRRGYLIVDRMGILILRDPYTSKPNVLFYTTKRTGGGVNDPRALRGMTVAA